MPRDKQKYSHFFFRITAPWEHIENKVKTIFEWIDYSGCMIAYHIGQKTEKPHAHIALVLKSLLQKESLDVRIKPLFGVKGSDYSSKPWDKDPQALRYGFHDPKGKVVNHLGLTEAEITQLKAESVIATQAKEDAKKRASNRLPDYILEKIKSSGDIWTQEEIAYEMFKAVYEGLFHNPANTHFENYINEVMIKQSRNEDELKTAWNERRKQIRLLNIKSTW